MLFAPESEHSRVRHRRAGRCVRVLLAAAAALAGAVPAGASEMQQLAVDLGVSAVQAHHPHVDDDEIDVLDVAVNHQGDVAHVRVTLAWKCGPLRRTALLYATLVNRADLRRLYDMEYTDNLCRPHIGCDRTAELITQWNTQFACEDTMRMPRELGQPLDGSGNLRLPVWGAMTPLLVPPQTPPAAPALAPEAEPAPEAEAEPSLPPEPQPPPVLMELPVRTPTAEPDAGNRVAPETSSPPPAEQTVRQRRVRAASTARPARSPSAQPPAPFPAVASPSAMPVTPQARPSSVPSPRQGFRTGLQVLNTGRNVMVQQTGQPALDSAGPASGDSPASSRDGVPSDQP